MNIIKTILWVRVRVLIKTILCYTMRSIKEMNDMNIIDTGVKSSLDFGNDQLTPHFIYCGDYYRWTEEKRRRFKEIFLAKVKRYGIQSSVLTALFMWRRNLVTKETVKKAYQGKLKNDEDWEGYERSIHDDLETFFINLQDRKKIQNEPVYSFFTPKLTEEELKLVEKRNEQHLSSYLYHYFGDNPDVDESSMTTKR